MPNKSTTINDVADADASPGDADGGTGERNPEEMEICAAADQITKFDPIEYLRAFYSSPTGDTAMQVVLFFLPGLSYWLPERVTTLLDLGAGPTIYVPLVFRNRAQHLYTSDASIQNCEMLHSWMRNQPTSEWNEICEWIAQIECCNESHERMQQCARDRLDAVLQVDLHSDEPIQSVYCTKACVEPSSVPKKFQVIVTIFCLEYSCETLDGYRQAVANTVKLIEPGGYLIQGGVFNADDYYFGGRRYKCHTLNRQQAIDALKVFCFC